jgi:ABC-type multidrug transport system, permease component
MIVFKNYFKILKSYKLIILLYIVILVFFTIFGTSNSENTANFTASKPKVAVINLEEKTTINKNLMKYLKKNAEIINLEEKEIDDSLFFRKIDLVLYIYDGYTEDFLVNKDKKLEIKTSGDSISSYAKILLNRYFKIADITNDYESNANVIVSIINESLEKDTVINLDNKNDIKSLDKASFYYNFSNYSILAISIYVIAMIQNRFKEEKIEKRNRVSSKKQSDFMKELFLGNFCFMLVVWLVLIIFSFVVAGSIMASFHGLLLIINSFIFLMFSVSAGFLIGNIVKNKDAINMIVNVVALGSSFLCGTFVPVEFLPDMVVKISRILPSYWFIKNNIFITEIETFTRVNIMEFLLYIFILILYTIVIYFITNILNNKFAKK